MQAKAAGNWPDATDPNFKYVTMLLNGDGTNGAQNNTFLDSSTNNFTITRNGNTTQGSFSPYGNLWSNFFNGSSNLSCNVSGISAGTNTFTLEFWVFLNAYPDSDAPFVDTRSSNGATTTAFQFGVYSTGALKLYEGSETNLGGTVPRNQWTHIALVRNGSNVVTAYINGTATGTTTTSTRNFSDNFFWIGCVPGPSSPYINAYLSNLRWVVGSALYTTTFTPSATPLTAVTNTQLLTCQSNRFVDNSSNNRTITVAGTPSVQRFSPFEPTAPYSTSVIGGSGYFDGSGDYLTLAASSSWELPANFTWECWAYPTNLSATPQRILHQGSTGTQKMIFYIDNSSGAFNFYYDGGSNFIVSSINLRANAWNHIAGVRNGSTITLYINGVSAGTATSSATLGDSSLGFAIGSNGGATDQFPGYISDARIVKGTAVYTSNFTPPTAPLTAITNTSLLTSMTNAGIPDLAMMNNLETVGNAQVSTSVVKYGTGSLAFDGSGDYLIASNNPAYAFSTGDFTMECWYYSGTTTQQTVLDTRNTSNGPGVLMYTLSNALRVYSNGGDAGGSINIPNNTWTHLVVERISGALYTYVNGVRDINGSSYTTNLTDNSFVAGLDTKASGFGLNGYLDDIRITKGLARYSGPSFTPPVAALPTF